MYKMRRGAAFENIMRHRVEDGLKIREARFRLEHAGDSDLQLITYVRQCAEEMGHTPNGCEVVGGSYIAERLGGWGKVVQLCGLQKPGPAPKWERRLPVRQEYAYQLDQFKKEKQAKKLAREQAKSEKTLKIGVAE